MPLQPSPGLVLPSSQTSGAWMTPSPQATIFRHGEPGEAKRRLAKGREVKYANELEAVIDRATARINFHGELWGAQSTSRNGRAAAAQS